MRNRFDRELDLLNEELIEMGNLIESSIEAAVTALNRTRCGTSKKSSRR